MSRKQWNERGPWAWDWEHNRPMWPIVASILAVIAWLVFILVYSLDWSKSYSLFQNIVVTLVSLAIVGLIIALGWVVWGMRHVGHWKRPEQPATAG